MTDDPAKGRFLAIQVMRLIGTGIALFGLVVITGKTDLPQPLGYPITLFGLFDALIFPIILTRRWKSPRE